MESNFLSQLILNSIIAGSVYTLVAIGFSLAYATTRFFNLAHGAVAVIGAYSLFFFINYLNFNLGLSLVLAILIAGLAGLLLDRLIFRTLRQKNASSMILLVASLGSFVAIEATIALLFTSQFQTLKHTFTNQTFRVFEAVITQIQLIMVICGVFIAIGLHLLLKKTLLGKQIQAVADDEEVSKIVGINTAKIMSWVFFIVSAIAGLAGVLVGLDIGIEPTMGMPLLLKGIIAAIIGGVGNIHGAILGAYILGFIENFGIWKISGEWKDAIAFGVLILFLIFKPNGLFRR